MKAGSKSSAMRYIIACGMGIKWADVDANPPTARACLFTYLNFLIAGFLVFFVRNNIFYIFHCQGEIVS